ncbi:MAG: DJ-1/PfpI family protein [Deinococcota bacterium]
MPSMTTQRNVAIILFDDVEVLDFAGPFEVLSVTGRRGGAQPFNAYTVAQATPVTARNGLSINPHYLLTTCPTPNIVVVPGGGGYHADGQPFGSRKEMHNDVLLEWLVAHTASAEHVLSVCTGALILANAKLTQGLQATTHHLALDALADVDPSLQVKAEQRIVDNGKVIFSGGISAGIDASLYMVAKLLGQDAAKETATYMEYDWQGAA